VTHDPPLFQAPAATAAPAQAETATATMSPAVRDLTFEGRDGAPVRVRGQLLAFGTSERDEHSHPTEFAARSERCSACRWFEVNIALVEAEIASDDCTCDMHEINGIPAHRPMCGLEPPSGRYLVVTAGRTVVPEEMNFRRAEFTDSPYEVVELLRVESARDRVAREAAGRSESEATRTLPPISARALAQAAAYDADLRAAYLAYSADRS
jgi:hypothetical protein